MKRTRQVRPLLIAIGAVALVLLATVSPARAAVTSLTLSPATITGGSGNTTIGTVTISAPAGVGGHEVDLTSSNTDLAASTERIVIPEGATSATFVVGTNALYRAYSGLAFSVTITATSRVDGTSASATLNVTAQAIPGPFTGGTASTDANATAGNICGGAFGAGNADERGILYDCRFTTPGTFSECSFLQECLSGCQTQSAPLLNQRDTCVTTPPVPIAVSPEIMEGGRRASGTLFLSAPAGSLTSANVNTSPGGEVSPGGGFPIPQGATSAPFDVDTFEVAVPAFLQVRADLANSPTQKFVQDYLAVVPAPGSTPPSGPLAVFSVDTTPMSVVQGNPSIGTVVLNGVAPSGGATVSLFTDNPAAEVPATVIVDAGQSVTAFPVTTSGVATNTPVTITANFGGVSRTTRITVSPFIFSTVMPALTDLAVTPASVVGGQRSIGRVTVSGPAPDPSDGAVSIALTSSNEAAVVVARNVTVGFGGTFADFRIRTFRVTTTTIVTITATFNGVSRSATLTVTPSGAPPPLALSSISVNPTSVQGGNPSTGTATLNQAAPAGGALVALSTSNTVATPPASVTVPAGQTSANFQISTTAVTAPTNATITGTLNGGTRSAILTVNPPTAPASVSALSVSPATVVGGESATGTVTLTAAAPAGGMAVSLSDDSPAVSVPASVTVPGGATSASFTVTTTNVTTSTSATISATGGGTTRTALLTVNPPPAPAAPTLVSPAQNATPAQPVFFDWSDVAHAASYEIQIDDSSTIAAPFVTSATVTASQTSIGGLPAQRLWWRVRARNSAGVFGPFSATRRFQPQVSTTAALSSVSVNPTSVVGGTSSTGTVTLTAGAPTGGAVVSLSSSNTAVATVPASVTVAAGATSNTFPVTTVSVGASTSVTITAVYNGTTRTTTLTVTPAASASLSAVSVSPASVTGGTSATGTATLTAAAPSGGAVVSLSSSNTAVANVPASVTVPAGATSANFTVTTSSVAASTSVTITGTYNAVSRTTTLTVNPAAQNATLTVTATGRAGERVTSNPAGINVSVGSTQSAPFAVGTPITLSVTNNRDAIWSGACSSGGNKTKTCTFTLNANASVTANVQ